VHYTQIPTYEPSLQAIFSGGVKLGKPDFDKLKENRDIKGLIKLLGDKDPWVREIAVKVLGNIGCGVTVASALAKMLKDKSPKIRSHAVYALGRITTPSSYDDDDRIAVSALIEALIDEDEGVRHSAAWALQYTDSGGRRDIERLFVDSEAAKDTVPILIAALKDKDEYVRQAAKEALEKIKTKES